MKKRYIRILCLILACSLAAMLVLPSYAETGLSNAVFLEQESTKTCTLSAAAMMMRAYLYLRFDNRWTSITEASISSAAWTGSSGLSWEWTSYIGSDAMKISHTSTSGGISAATLKALLDQHKEGIVLYCYGKALNSIERQHAVLVTDYEGDTFYCADPYAGKSGQRRTLESSQLGVFYGSQQNILKKAGAYWYVASYSGGAAEAIPDWASSGIYYVYGNGLMNGMEGGFQPNTPMTRGMLVTVLWRYAGQKTGYSNSFTDVQQGRYYTEAIAWAAANGIVDGMGDGTFVPEGNITREQLATILYRYCGQPGAGATDSLSTYPDADSVSNYAKDAMRWAVDKGIVNGSEGKLLPKDNATRAEVATMLMRFIENVLKANMRTPMETDLHRGLFCGTRYFPW